MKLGFQIKLFLFFLLLTVGSLLGPIKAIAGEEFKVPRLTGPVVDEANVIEPYVQKKLENLLYSYNQSGRAQINVLTLLSLNGEPIESASIKILDQWKLGDSKKDNGVLFLLVPSERKVRIEVGQGLEGTLPDVIAKRIIEDISKPYFKQNRYGEGLYFGVLEILKYVDHEHGDQSVQESSYSRSGTPESLLMSFLLAHPLVAFFLILMLIIIVIAGGGGGGGRRGPWGGGGFGSGGFGGFGGGSGGGWSGGGGGFSGGGASGNW